MTIAKSINKTLDISVEDVRIDLTATIRSYDLTDTQFIFEIKSSNGMTVNLTGSTAMYIVEYVHNSQTYAIQGDVNIIGTDTLSFNLPEDLKGYSGTVLIGIYVKLTDGTKIDIKDIAVRIEPSIMDKDIDFSAKAYFKDFETVKAEVILEGEKAKTSINAVVSDVQQTGDAAKEEIKATLPSVQAQVSELKEDLDKLYYGGEEHLLDVENAVYTANLNDAFWGIDYLFKKGYIEKIKFNSTSGDSVAGDAIIIITDANKKILRKIRKREISNEIDINYNAEVDFYVFVSCKGVKYGRTNRVISYFNSPRSNSVEKNEGDILFDSWSGENNFIFDYSVVMSDYKRYIKYNEYKKIYTLQDAYTSWIDGQKFPIVVLGDSTSIGANTTNYKPNVIGDYIINDHAYPYLLQELLKVVTNNGNLKIYNSSFSGKDAKWCLENLDKLIFNHSDYSDAKIAFISFGINDYVYTKEKYDTYISNLSKIVERLYIHGIQPVILSTQAGFENNQRYGYKIMSLVDKANEEVAKKYNLDFIDKNAYTRWFNMYSNRGMNVICSDSCHYGDYGHQFEAGFLFKELIPQVITIGRGTHKVGFQTEEIKTDLVYSSFNTDSWEVSNVDPLTNNGFKLMSNNTSNKKQMDFYVFIFDTAPKRLIFYCSQVNGQTVTLEQSLGSNTVNITSTEQILANNLDLGLWHITVNGGSGTLGFKFVDNN